MKTTSNSASRVIVVGGGISGLVAALELVELRGKKVQVIERDREVGGLLRSFDYGEHGRFDYGMHTMFDTGSEELDRLLYGLLPEGEWQSFAGWRRDLAGLYFAGRLQENSPYIDLRSLSNQQYARCVSDFFINVDRNGSIDKTSAQSYARSRFGEAIAEVVTASVQKLYGRSAESMDVMATMITPMDRVVMFDEHVFHDLMKSDLLRSRLAFPEQRNLPVELSSGRRGYYPRRYGMYRVIDALVKRLRAAGVEITTSAEVRAVCFESGRVTALEVVAGGHSTKTAPVDTLYWTSGLPPLARALRLLLEGVPFDKPRKTVIANFLIDRPLPIDLYYFYCYDDGFRTLRLTNYEAYCSGAARNGGHPITLELLVDDAEAASRESLLSLATDELRRLDVLASGTRITFSAVEVLPSGFPMPSLKSTEGMNVIRDKVTQLGLSNLIVLGILAEPNLFFQRDVLSHAHRRLAMECS